MKRVYIVAACRTPIGSFGGALKSKSAVDLGALVIKECLRRAEVEPTKVCQVIMGNVLQGGQGQNTARQAAVNAGMPFEVPAMTINKVCGSSLAAINLAAYLIRAGEAECIVAGGMESMSNASHFVPELRWGKKMGDFSLVDSMIKDGLWDAFNGYHMGITAENLAQKYAISRKEQDEYALVSQQKASRAQKQGKFKEEIVPVEITGKKGEIILFSDDESIRHDASSEGLAALRPAFAKDGTVTAGNASGINDAAAAVVVVSEDFLKAHGLKPMASHVAGGSCGVDPALMGLGPVPSVKAALRKGSLALKSIDLIEANEAFAAQALTVARELDFDAGKVNVNGGAIALGHPIGASGARIAVTLLHEMKRRSAEYGLSTLCIGGGMGEAAIFQAE